MTNAAKSSTGAALFAGTAFFQAIGDNLQPWIGAMLLGMIALGIVVHASWPRLRRALLRGLAEELDVAAPDFAPQPESELQVRVVLEGGPEFTTDVRFQARVVDPTGRPLDAGQTRAYLQKTRGPEGPTPTVQTSLVTGSRADELVLDGHIAFDDDRDGRQLGEWELVIEAGRGARRGRAQRRLRIVHAIDPAQPAAETFERTSDWSTTAALELRGEGPKNGGFGEALLRQRFQFADGLGVSGRLRYRLHDPREAGEFELAWGPNLAVRLRLGPSSSAGLGPAGGQAPLRELLIPTADEDGIGELEFNWKVERTPEGLCATLIIDGMTAVSSTFPFQPGSSSWRLALRVRKLTAFAEGWTVLAA